MARSGKSRARRPRPRLGAGRRLRNGSHNSSLFSEFWDTRVDITRHRDPKGSKSAISYKCSVEVGLVSPCRRMVGHSEDGFCTKPTAHGDRQQRWGGAGVRSGKHRRLGGTATTATGDSRRSTATAAKGFAGASRVLFFLGRGCGSLLPVLPGLHLLLWAGELRGSAGNSSPVDHHSHATGGSHHGPRRTARRRDFPRPPGSTGTSRRYVAHGTGHEDPAATAARGDGGQPRREHRGGTDSKGTLAGRVFRVEPPEHSLLTEPPMQRAK